MKNFIIAALLLLAVGACVPKPTVTVDLVVTPADGAVEDFVSLNQGWNNKVRDQFWFTSQGSEVMPYTWFTWLEQPESEELFRNTEHMEMLGYFPLPASKSNPSGLPVGFAMTQSKKMKDAFVGLTCAACHTNLIEHGDTKMLIDGAPTLANYGGFLEEFVASLNNTHNNEEKFTRFATKILGEAHSKEDAETLREELLKASKGASQRIAVNKLPEGYPSDFVSYGRLDAVTRILNASTAIALDMPENKNYPIAPVSYPFLWGTHQSNVVQWNGGVPNIPRTIGPMVRNATESIGVYGGLRVTEKNGQVGKIHYESTVDFIGLGRLEGWVKSLESPQWNDPKSKLPKVDKKMVARGKILYKDNCARCHSVVAKKDQDQNYEATLVSLSEVGTDPMNSWAVAHYRASTGILEGTKQNVFFGKPFADSTRALSIAGNGAIGLAKKSLLKVLTAIAATAEEGPIVSQEKLQEGLEQMDSLQQIQYQEAGHQQWSVMQNTPTDLKLDGLKYKARPLNGIWATAPYLHNGSVPNLWELLKAPKDRMPTFWVGSRKFDAKNVGFVTDEGKNEFRVMDGNGEIMLGNSNLGHDYAGGQYTDQQKWDLIEYMKTL